jgi:hypothetical protein
MIQLTHANLKTPIYLVASLIYCYYFSETHKATLIMGNGGALIPVSESPEEVANALK